jgi:hypothetical protein
MNLMWHPKDRRAGGRRRAYTFVEVMVAVVLTTFMFISLYLAFSAGFAAIRTTRENSGATQILVKRSEEIRLCNWTQLQDPAYVPASFTDATTLPGTTYGGTIEVLTPTNLGSPGYLDQMRTVTITVRWTNGTAPPEPHERVLQTQVARWGMQNYQFGYRP